MDPESYKYLSPSDRKHFLEHGWLHVPNAIQPAYLDPWLENLWTRLGPDWNPKDPSSWKDEYIKLPRHREVKNEEFCTPEAWGKICEIVGGEDKIDPVRERYYGDQWIINLGSAKHERMLEAAKVKGTDGSVTVDETQLSSPRDATGWHIDNDWYRQFLDSSGNGLTLIFLFTDVPEHGGGTYVCEDGIEVACKYLLEHPEGLDHPYNEELLRGMKQKARQESFRSIVGKKGDLFVTHQLLPHSHAPNYLRYARVITNPHCNLREDYCLNREDGHYTLCEQVILRALNRSSIPPSVYTPTRDRLIHYPRTAYFKRARIDQELKNMLEEAAAKGLPASSVDSVYLKGEEAIKEHEKRNGYDAEWGPNGVEGKQAAGVETLYKTGGVGSQFVKAN